MILRGFRQPIEKWWPDRLLYATIFKRVLDITRIKGENSIQIDWKFEGSKQGISCSRTEYNILFREKAYPNVGN